MKLSVVSAYVAFGLLVLCLALLIRLPASLVPKLLEEQTQGHSVRLSNPRGSLWRGAADVSVTDFALGSLNWQLSPLKLLLLSPGVDWQLEDTDLSGQLEQDGASVIMRLSGTLDVARLAPLLSRYAIDAQGRLRFDDFQLHAHPQAPSLAGQIHWTGGQVHIRVGRWQASRLLPAMRASVTESSRILVTLWDERVGVHLPAGEIELLEDGWVKLGATGHLANRFNASMADATDPDAILVSVEHRLL